jgi:hypothetical protein
MAAAILVLAQKNSQALVGLGSQSQHQLFSGYTQPTIDNLDFPLRWSICSHIDSGFVLIS